MEQRDSAGTPDEKPDLSQSPTLALFPKNLLQRTNKGQMPRTEQALDFSRISSLGVIAARIPSGHVTTDAFTDVPAGSLVCFLRT